MAPLASEAPELLVAGLFAWRLNTNAALGTLVSSKVNQWTLLVGAIPLVYAFSVGALTPMELDPRQREELLLTSAQSLFAAVILSDFHFSLQEALLLASLFLAQMFFPQPEIRYAFAAVYLLLAVGMLLTSRQRRRTLWRALRLKIGEPALVDSNSKAAPGPHRAPATRGRAKVR